MKKPRGRTVRNGLMFGLLFGLKTAWRTADQDIRLSGALRLSFGAARKGAKSGGIAGAIVGVILTVIVLILQWRQQTTAFSPLIVIMFLFPAVCVVAAMLVGLLFALVAALFSLFSPSDLPRKTRPGQGAILSAQNALLAGVVVAAVTGILTANSLFANESDGYKTTSAPSAFRFSCGRNARTGQESTPGQSECHYRNRHQVDLSHRCRGRHRGSPASVLQSQAQETSSAVDPATVFDRVNRFPSHPQNHKRPTFAVRK